MNGAKAKDRQVRANPESESVNDRFDKEAQLIKPRNQRNNKNGQPSNTADDTVNGGEEKVKTEGKISKTKISSVKKAHLDLRKLKKKSDNYATHGNLLDSAKKFEEDFRDSYLASLPGHDSIIDRP